MPCIAEAGKILVVVIVANTFAMQLRVYDAHLALIICQTKIHNVGLLVFILVILTEMKAQKVPTENLKINLAILKVPNTLYCLTNVRGEV